MFCLHNVNSEYCHIDQVDSKTVSRSVWRLKKQKITFLNILINNKKKVLTTTVSCGGVIRRIRTATSTINAIESSRAICVCLTCTT